jgi:hypothetical protein
MKKRSPTRGRKTKPFKGKPAKQIITDELDELHDFQAALVKRVTRHALPDLVSHGQELREQFRAKFPAANDSCPHCQAHGASLKHQAGCPNETKRGNETYVPPECLPAVHWRSIYYIKIRAGSTDIPLGVWIPRGGIDPGDRSEADLERDGWVRADGRYVATPLEFPKTPGRVPDLFPRFLPDDPHYVEGANNMVPIYWGDHT